MGSVTRPEMRRYGYYAALYTVSLAISGTLAILIPPSVLMVVYGIWTETSIGALFIAGIVPGVLLTVIFSAYIFMRCRLNPAMGPVGPKYPLGEKLRASKSLLPIDRKSTRLNSSH